MSADWVREAIAAIVRGEEPPEGVLVHVTRETTQADWDALDPNSFESDCRDCGAYIVGQFAADPAETVIRCPECGSTNHGGVGSPAGAFSLAMHDPACWDFP